MNKKLSNFLVVTSVLLGPIFALALTKPAPGADVESLSYVFYLYYDQGQLFADRDYEIKFNVLNEKFTSETPNPQTSYKGEIVNFKSEVVKTFQFDPQRGDPRFLKGKVSVRGPYAADALKASFYDGQGKQLLSVFVSQASICDNSGLCDSEAGENEQICPNECKKPRITTPQGTRLPPPPVSDEGPDITTILTYVVGGVGVAVVAWFGWKWWRKRREGSFPLPPPSPPPSPIS